ncbi:MAG TPA: DinB family protein [Candidatus Acidoferrales bacterium]
MDAADFRVLFEYNAWANRRTLESCASLTPEQFLQDMKSSFASVRDTLAHIYGAEFIWVERWNSRIPAALPTPADFPSFESIRTALTNMDAALIGFVSGLTPERLSRNLDYKLLNGTAQSGPLGPMLQHVANHGTYHRGQIATFLRQLGTRATSTDLIAYHRELAARATA